MCIGHNLTSINSYLDHILKDEDKLRGVEQKLDELEESRVALAQYFCEDKAKFKVTDAIETFNTLCLKIADARKVSIVF